MQRAETSVLRVFGVTTTSKHYRPVRSLMRCAAAALTLARSLKANGSDFVDNLRALGSVFGVRDHTPGARRLQLLYTLGDRTRRWRDGRLADPRRRAGPIHDALPDNVLPIGQ